MKLRFDENLSRRLVGRLEELYPESIHVSDAGLLRATDWQIWQYAKDGGYTVVTADSDFLDLEALWGPPPKVVWLRAWKHPSRDAEALLRREAIRLAEFEKDVELGVLILSWS